MNKLYEELNLQIEDDELVKKFDAIEKDENGNINFQVAVDSL